MNHLEHIEEIAIRAAEIYGQDFKALHEPSKQIYRDTIKSTSRSGGQTVFEKAIGHAIEEFYTGILTPDVPSAEAEQAQPEAEPAPKTKKKDKVR